RGAPEIQCASHRPQQDVIGPSRPPAPIAIRLLGWRIAVNIGRNARNVPRILAAEVTDPPTRWSGPRSELNDGAGRIERPAGGLTAVTRPPDSSRGDSMEDRT